MFNIKKSVKFSWKRFHRVTFFHKDIIFNGENFRKRGRNQINRIKMKCSIFQNILNL